jgi:hypothetical protein
MHSYHLIFTMRMYHIRRRSVELFLNQIYSDSVILQMISLTNSKISSLNAKSNNSLTLPSCVFSNACPNLQVEIITRSNNRNRVPLSGARAGNFSTSGCSARLVLKFRLRYCHRLQRSPQPVALGEPRRVKKTSPYFTDHRQQTLARPRQHAEKRSTLCRLEN